MRALGLVEGVGELQRKTFGEGTSASLGDRPLYLVPLEIG